MTTENIAVQILKNITEDVSDYCTDRDWKGLRPARLAELEKLYYNYQTGFRETLTGEQQEAYDALDSIYASIESHWYEIYTALGIQLGTATLRLLSDPIAVVKELSNTYTPISKSEKCDLKVLDRYMESCKGAEA